MGFTKSNIVHTKNSTRFKGELYGVLIIGLAGSKMSAHRFFSLQRFKNTFGNSSEMYSKFYFHNKNCLLKKI